MSEGSTECELNDICVAFCIALIASHVRIFQRLEGQMQHPNGLALACLPACLPVSRSRDPQLVPWLRSCEPRQGFHPKSEVRLL